LCTVREEAMITLEEFKKAPSANVSEFMEGKCCFRQNSNLTKAWCDIFGSSVLVAYCVDNDCNSLVHCDGVNIEHYLQYILTEKGLFYVYGSEWGGVYKA